MLTKGTLEVLQVIHVSLKWSSMHSANKEYSIVANLRKSLSLFCECLSTMSNAHLTSFPRQSRLWHGPMIGFCSQHFLFLCSQPLHVQGSDPTTQTFPHALVGGTYNVIRITYRTIQTTMLWFKKFFIYIYLITQLVLNLYPRFKMVQIL